MSTIEYKIDILNIPQPNQNTIKPRDIIDGLDTLNDRPKIVVEVQPHTFCYGFRDNARNKSTSYFWGSYETLEKDNGKPVKFFRETESGYVIVAATEGFSRELIDIVEA